MEEKIFTESPYTIPIKGEEIKNFIREIPKSPGVYKFLEAYPVQILPIEFDVSNRNTTMRYSVLFNCTEYLFDGSNYKTSSKSRPGQYGPVKT